MAVTTRLLGDKEALPGARIEQYALDLARAMPRLTLDARRVANALVHGLHGRHRAGPGENFWQFRHFSAGEAAIRVDWRRSARDDHLYVREREWDTAQTIWLWVDRSPSMAFSSSLAQAPKIERAFVLCFALADLLVRGGERVGLIGRGRASSSRAVVERLAEAFLLGEGTDRDLPPGIGLPPTNEAVLIGDFLDPPAETAARMNALASRGARGHLLMIVDPIEESFPFNGRVELIDPETQQKLTAGRAQTLREDYQRLLAAHREVLRAEAHRLGWSLTLHHTDRPAAQAVLALHPLLRSGGRPA